MYFEFSHQDRPADIFPLVLTSATQELFSCRPDEDVTEKSPYKLLKKDDIIQDMKTRAAVSDFTPVKQIVFVSLIWKNTPRHYDNIWILKQAAGYSRLSISLSLSY